MNKKQLQLPKRPKPSLLDAYNGYYGNLDKFYEITVRFWENRSSMYNDVSLLCTSFPEHTSPSSNNGFMNEFHIRNLKECYKYFKIWNMMEFYMRNWKYCEYYISLEPVYHNEMDCYIRHVLKNVTFPEIKFIDPKEELQKRRGKWIHEKQLFYIIESLYPDCTVKYHYRAKWLENLELDIYIKELNLGFEYQGIQHYEVVAHWGGEIGLKKRQFNDVRKKELCKANGVILIYFDYTDILTKENVKGKIDKTLKRKK